MNNRHQATTAGDAAVPAATRAATLGARLRAAARRFSPRADDELGREQEQATVRVVIVAGVILYLLARSPANSMDAWFLPPLPDWLVYLVAYLALSVAVMVLTFRATAVSRVRHTTMNVGDAAAISYLMIVTGELGIPLFVLYLWITIGNGFRFGTRALGVSMLLCVGGFATVFALSPVWRGNATFAASVFVALLVLPLYVAHLIVLLNRALARATRHDLLTRVNDDLQAPLKDILGAAELLESNQRLTPDERSLLAVLRDSVQSSLKQIENVLDFTRLESGGFTADAAACDLHRIVNDAAELVRPAATQKGLRLLRRIDPHAPYRLIGDARHLSNILLHLLSHAVKHARGGLVCLDVTPVDDVDEYVTLRFEIRFDGPDTSAAPAGGETGADRHDHPIGIALATRLVELMRGRIGVERERDNRLLRWFEIGFDRQPDAGAEPTLRGVRTLLLSQDAATVDRFRHLLVQAEGQLLPTASGAEALDLLTRAIRLGNPVHALLIDADLAFAPDGSHRLAELSSKAQSANVSLILIADALPPAAALREAGYSAALPRRAPAQHVLAALHAIPLWDVNAGGSVVNVAPWVWSRREARRPRILVADDNRTNLMIVRRMLEQAGYDVDDKATGAEALESLCAGGYRLAILDMHMPDLGGISVLRQYRQRRPRSRLPTIILTANVSLDAQQQSADAGADAYLSKPVTTADLLNEVERLVRESEVEALTPTNQSGENDDAGDDTVLQVEVLAELDRLYQNPQSLAQVIQGYRHEGTDLLDKIGEACETNNHAAFGEWIRALKSNAANMGAVKLMRACSEIESIGLIDFRRQREQVLSRLRIVFAESLDALYELVQGARPPSANHTE